MDKSQRAEYDRAYRERAGVARKAKQAEWRAENAEHLKVRCTNRRIKKRAMCGEWWFLLDGAFRVDRRRGKPNPARLYSVALMHSPYCHACEAEQKAQRMAA
jgi:hypothetical protein